MATPRIMLLGAPGAGKGTQSANLADHYGIDHITTGDALRANKDMETEYGTPREFMEAGELVPDPVVNEIVEAAIDEADGFVLDGYPRNRSQAEYLESITDLDAVLYLEVSDEELIHRIAGRRLDPETNDVYHVEYNPPEDPAVEDRLVQRDDDTEEMAQERIGVFKESTLPVVEHFDATGDLVRIDGEQSPAAVWSDVRAAVDAAIDA